MFSDGVLSESYISWQERGRMSGGEYFQIFYLKSRKSCTIVQLFIKIQIIQETNLSANVVHRLMPFIFYFKIHSFSQSKCKNANFLQTQNLSFSENLTFLYSILSRDLHEQLCKISAFLHLLSSKIHKLNLLFYVVGPR